jgi:hypothetical protein
MDPASLIVGALAAGAAETTEQVVKDAYEGLKSLLLARFAGRGSAEVALAERAEDPETWRGPLERELAVTGAAADAQVLVAARELLELVGPAGAEAGASRLDLRGARGVQVGDRNRQVNVFGRADR